MPVWLAPNVITLLGFMFTISQAVLITYHDPNFNNNSIPSWVWFYLAFAQFMAQTLDGIDGKQARKLGKGSPLGEIFDHSVDSWSAHIFIMSIISAVGVDDNDENHFNRLDVMIQMWAFLFTWYLAFVESFIMKVHTIPWAYDATLIALTVLYLVCGVFGTTFLHKKT